jgi:hypothetical protein
MDDHRLRVSQNTVTMMLTTSKSEVRGSADSHMTRFIFRAFDQSIISVPVQEDGAM